MRGLASSRSDDTLRETLGNAVKVSQTHSTFLVSRITVLRGGSSLPSVSPRRLRHSHAVFPQVLLELRDADLAKVKH